MTEKCLKDPTYAIFWKSWGFKDVKYDIPMCQSQSLTAVILHVGQPQEALLTNHNNYNNDQGIEESKKMPRHSAVYLNVRLPLYINQ